MSDTPELAVVLINYNNEEDTIACLESLAEQTIEEFLTIVVDNDSEPDSFEAVKASFDYPVYLRNSTNRGFTGGNNEGIEYALNEDVEWILLLNNDTELDPNFLEDFLIAAKDQSEDVGIVGPKIHTYDSDRIWSAGGVVNKWTATTGSLHDTNQSVDRPQKVELVAGAALLVRNGVFEDVGLLDDDFFIYYEETEFCERARAAGWVVMYLPVEGVYHKETTTYSYSSFGEYYLIRNRLLFQKKTKPIHVQAVFYPYYVLRWVLLQTIYLLLVEKNLSVAKATFKGGLDGIAGRFGKRHGTLLQYN